MSTKLVTASTIKLGDVVNFSGRYISDPDTAGVWVSIQSKTTTHVGYSFDVADANDTPSTVTVGYARKVWRFDETEAS